VDYLREDHQLSIQQACLLMHLARSMYYYQRVERSDHELITALEQLALDHPRYGFRKMFFTLRNQGHRWNHKKVYRVYCLLGLNLKRKAKRRLPARIKEPLEVPDGPNQVWSIDFMSHSLYDGRRFRVLNIIDDFNREALWMEADTSIGSQSVVELIGLVVREMGKPLQMGRSSSLLPLLITVIKTTLRSSISNLVSLRKMRSLNGSMVLLEGKC